MSKFVAKRLVVGLIKLSNVEYACAIVMSLKKMFW